MKINAIEPQGRRRKTLSELSPEVLLSIFSNFDSNEVVVFRRVCKQFLNVIDTNKLLWRIFEWVQQKEDEVYPSQAIDLFDEKSGSTLEEVSIQQSEPLTKTMLTEFNIKHLSEVLKRSRASIKRITIKSFDRSKLLDQILQLANSLPRLKELILRKSSLNVRFKNVLSERSKSDSRSQLKILALPEPRGIQILTLPIDSLVSFSCEELSPTIPILSFITQFSETVLHLDLATHGSMKVEPLLCPRLKVLQAVLEGTVTSYFNCPNLQVLILESVINKEVEELPPSLEEIWLVGRASFSSYGWNFLQDSCPRLETLKLGERFGRKVYDDDEVSELDLFAFIGALEGRQRTVESGKEIDGVKMNPLQKVVIPTEFFKKAQLQRLERVVVEVVDLKKYPDFIEVEY